MPRPTAAQEVCREALVQVVWCPKKGFTAAGDQLSWRLFRSFKAPLRCLHRILHRMWAGFFNCSSNCCGSGTLLSFKFLHSQGKLFDHLLPSKSHAGLTGLPILSNHVKSYQIHSGNWSLLCLHLDCPT